ETHPEYEEELVQATTIISSNDSPETFMELAQYYLKKGNKERAARYFEEGLKLDPNNFLALKNMLLLYIDLKEFEKVKQKSEAALNKYPAQSVLYLIHGVSLNALNKGKEAVETLETGLDYIIDDSKMEADFYKQLSIAYTLMNNTSKAKTFMDKAKQLESP